MKLALSFLLTLLALFALALIATAPAMKPAPPRQAAGRPQARVSSDQSVTGS